MSILLTLVLTVVVTPLSAAPCRFSKSGAALACADNCCPTKACCASPARDKNPPAQPLATNGVAADLSLDPPPLTGVLIGSSDFGSRCPDRGTYAHRTAKLRRALFCTFLI